MEADEGGVETEHTQSRVCQRMGTLDADCRMSHSVLLAVGNRELKVPPRLRQTL